MGYQIAEDASFHREACLRGNVAFGGASADHRPLQEVDEVMAGQRECLNRTACGVRHSVGQGDEAEEGRSEEFGCWEDHSADEAEVDESVP